MVLVALFEISLRHSLFHIFVLFVEMFCLIVVIVSYLFL